MHDSNRSVLVQLSQRAEIYIQLHVGPYTTPDIQDCVWRDESHIEPSSATLSPLRFMSLAF